MNPKVLKKTWGSTQGRIVLNVSNELIINTCPSQLVSITNSYPRQFVRITNSYPSQIVPTQPTRTQKCDVVGTNCHGYEFTGSGSKRFLREPAFYTMGVLSDRTMERTRSKIGDFLKHIGGPATVC